MNSLYGIGDGLIARGLAKRAPVRRCNSATCHRSYCIETGLMQLTSTHQHFCAGACSGLFALEGDERNPHPSQSATVGAGPHVHNDVRTPLPTPGENMHAPFSDAIRHACLPIDVNWKAHLSHQCLPGTRPSEGCQHCLSQVCAARDITCTSLVPVLCRSMDDSSMACLQPSQFATQRCCHRRCAASEHAPLHLTEAEHMLRQESLPLYRRYLVLASRHVIAAADQQLRRVVLRGQYHGASLHISYT